GNMIGRSIFADLNEGTEPGIPDGLKVDTSGRVYCTGPGGIWVITPDGKRVGIIKWPEQAVNFAFGGPDLRTLLCCAHTSVYTLRVKVRDQARIAEREIMAGGYRGPLHGIPFGLKDIYCTAGIRTTSHSRICADYVPTEDATTVTRLYQAGAVLLGKLATHEFAHG